MRPHRIEMLLAVGCATVVAGTLLGTGASVAAVESKSTPAEIVDTGATTHTRVNGSLSAFTLVVPKSVSRSQLQARAVIARGSSCPKLRVTKSSGGTKSIAMGLRVPGATTKTAFASVRVCQHNIPTKTTRAAIGSTTIPASLPKRIRHIALLGDSGCDVDDGGPQNCGNPADWPIAGIARRIAQERPDMTMLLGDYFYREDPCPADAQDKCGGSPPPITDMPFKDTDYGWIADALNPLAPVFAAAPIMPIRGNHESCQRGGNGYFLFFDSSPLGAAACAPNKANKLTDNITPSWAVDLPIKPGRTLRAVVVDSAYGRNKEISSWSKTQRTAYQQAARLAKQKAGRESWLLTHRPLFGVESTLLTDNKPAWTQWTAVDQTAAAAGLLGGYDTILSSHIHTSQVVQLRGLPGQVVIGNGGTKLDPTTGYSKPKYGPLQSGTGAPLTPGAAAFPTANYLWTDTRFGYAVVKPLAKASHWQLTLKSTAGKPYRQCTLARKQASCR